MTPRPSVHLFSDKPEQTRPAEKTEGLWVICATAEPMMLCGVTITGL